MYKLVVCLIISLGFSILSPIYLYAQSSKISLDVVPSSLKKDYSQKTGKDWDISSYDERKAFWDSWLIEKKKELEEKSQTYKDYQEYGEDYSNVPFDIRYMFGRTYGKNWEDATNEEKKDYLTKYEDDKKAYDKQRLKEQKLTEKEEKARQKEKLRQKRLEEKILRAKEKEKERKRKEEERKNKAFHKMVEKQKKKIEKMRREMEKLHK